MKTYLTQPCYNDGFDHSATRNSQVHSQLNSNCAIYIVVKLAVCISTEYQIPKLWLGEGFFV